jgi:hypothetical protein
MKEIKFVASALAVISLLAARGVASTSLPYLDTFEAGSWSVAGPWSVAGGGTAVGSADYLLQGTKSVKIDNAALTLNVTADVKNNNAWVQVYARPVPGSDDPPAPAASVSGAFYLKNDGKLRAYGNFTGDKWETVHDFGSVPSGWMGFILHIDYVNQAWDIYENSGVYGSPMTRLNTGPILFPTTAGAPANMTAFTVQSGGSTYIDAVGVARGGPAVPGSSLSKVDIYEFATSETGDMVLPAYSEAYAQSGGNHLKGAVGLDLRSGLQDGDIITVYSTGGWSDFKILNGDWTEGPYVNQLAINVDIGPATPLRIQRKSGNPSTLGFFAYGSAVLTKDGDATGACSFTLTMKGNASPDLDAAGFTYVRGGKALTLSTLPWNDTCATGDRLYKATPAAPFAYKLFAWNDALNRWERWGAVPSVADSLVAVGSKMWIYRAGSETTVPITW